VRRRGVEADPPAGGDPVSRRLLVQRLDAACNVESGLLVAAETDSATGRKREGRIAPALASRHNSHAGAA
jgi:hypothetical protein